ncbi:unnamed protein product [Brassica oleracea var. botrytis]
MLFVDSQAVQFIESTQEADGSRYGSCRVCYTYASRFALRSYAKHMKLFGYGEGADFFLKRQNSNGDIHRTRRKSKPGANRLGIDRPPREIDSVFAALRN